MPPVDAILQVTIPWQTAGRPAIAIAHNYGYQAFLGVDDNNVPIPNPMTMLDFAASIIMKFVKENCIAYEVPDLAKADRQARIDEINAFAITVLRIQ